MQSLAAVVYELLGGTLSPVMIGGLGTQPSPRYVPVAALPETGNEVLKKALDPQRSYASAGEFCQALEATLSGDYRAQLSPVTKAPTAPPQSPLAAREAREPSAREPREPSGRVLPPVARPRSRVPWLGIIAGCACCAAGVGLWYMNRPAPPPEIAAVSPTPAAPAPTEAPATTPAPTPAPPTPTPTPDPQAVMKAKLQEGQDAETAHDWPKAIQSYLGFAHTYPDVDTGRIRLETMLSSQHAAFAKLPPDQFDKLRPAVTDAAHQDIVSAMLILGDQLRAAAPTDAFAWYCAAAARGNAPAMTQAGLMVSNGAGVTQNYTQAADWFQWAAYSGDAARQDLPRRVLPLRHRRLEG